MKHLILLGVMMVFCWPANTQSQSFMLQPSSVFDGFELHENWVVIVQDGMVQYAGNSEGYDQHAKISVIKLDGHTLMPGMIEGHSHILLHPYNETSWNDQVLKESRAERVARAVNHVNASLMAGFTTMRDLGSEGAGYDDVGIKKSIDKGIIAGPRLLVAGKAIVATGSYGPKGFAEHVSVPLGAEEADGNDDLLKVVRDQIGKGADIIKVYADYRWGPNGEARPTFSIEELKLIVNATKSSGRVVVAHASSAEAMKRATLAGVSTIEHGDGGTENVFKLMKQRKVALCPTLAAGDAIMQYRGWKKGIDPEPDRIRMKKNSFQKALQIGVNIVAGGDVGVFPHGDNVRELEMMVDYGMDPKDVLIAVTSGNAETFNLKAEIGTIKKGMIADLIAVSGNPVENISNLRKVKFVMKGGVIYKNSLEE